MLSVNKLMSSSLDIWHLASGKCIDTIQFESSVISTTPNDLNLLAVSSETTFLNEEEVTQQEHSKENYSLVSLQAVGEHQKESVTTRNELSLSPAISPISTQTLKNVPYKKQKQSADNTQIFEVSKTLCVYFIKII